MSIFNELLPKILEISNSYSNKYKNELKEVFECFDKWEDEFLKEKTRDKHEKNIVSTLQSINEDENESTKTPENKSNNTNTNNDHSSSESNERGPKKRSKHEVEGMESPEQEKRQKRNASVKAQNIISKQVNVNLTQKLRRENSIEKNKNRRCSKDGDKENTEPIVLVQVKEEKISLPMEPMEVSSTEEITLPINIEIKQEVNKDNISMPPPMAPIPKPRKALQKEKSEERSVEESSSRRRTTRTRKQTDTLPAQTAVQKDKLEESSAEESSSRRRTTRTRKQAETLPEPSVASSRSTRASSRATKLDVEEIPTSDTRPKRTRAKKAPPPVVTETEKDSPTSLENESASPAEKTKPKRTRKGQKAEAKEIERQTKIAQTEAETDVFSPKEDDIIVPQPQSPVLPTHAGKRNLNTEKNKVQHFETKTNTETNANIEKTKNFINKVEEMSKNEELRKIQDIVDDTKDTKNLNKDKAKDDIDNEKTKIVAKNDLEIIEDTEPAKAMMELTEDVVDDALDKTRVLGRLDSTVIISKDLDKTMILPNGAFIHAPVESKEKCAMNETVVLESARTTALLDKPHQNAIMDTTVVLDKAGPQTTNMTDDNSLLTDDSDTPEVHTPIKKPPATQPTSAVKERVQQFEEMASRVTRTKTRALAKKEDQPEDHTPPDKTSKAILSNETLAKMNSMIFNGKPPSQVPNSASKPRTNIVTSTKSLIPTSASKLSGINKAREADELRREREDARKKKEAMLEAKREQQKKKREDKMAAAAAARIAAEKERRAAMEVAARERMEKQAHADLGRQERLKEAERKKQDLARKVAETEERRKAEEQARQQRLADEQKRAEAARRKQLEDAELFKKEAALMQKEIERKQKEFIERQKMKQRMDGEKILTPHKSGMPYPPLEPVYMADGFQYLNSDDDDDDNAPDIPQPSWSVSKTRRVQLCIQARIPTLHVDKLFSVREHTPDLREIFPTIERSRLKRTSSAVWRTPPSRLPAVQE